ncbi:hypothetical protein GCM10027020_25910 [Nocardioides salsibiostraticola]
MTRGPLPSGVYWRRRGFAVLLAITLVFVIARVLSGGSDASDGVAAGQETAQQVAAEPTPAATTSGNPGQGKKKKKKAVATPTPLAEPSGPCIDADLVVTPLVPEAIAGSGVPIVLQLRTNFAEACTWEVSANHVTVKITSGDDDVWSTLDCPGPVPVEDVVVRRDVTSTVGLVWGAKRSDDDCSALTDWALPGTYQVVAAAFGGEPTDATFELESPSPEIIVTTPKPTPNKNTQKNKNKKKQN